MINMSDGTFKLFCLKVDHSQIIVRAHVVRIGLWSFFIFILYQTFAISLNLVGSFERILHELDETIKGEIRRHIKVRDHDGLANELLKRVNVLIDNLPLPKAPLKIR